MNVTNENEPERTDITEWTDQENMQLVKEVEKYPILYDPQLPDHSKRSETDKAWNAIGKVMKISGPHCRERWKNARVVFMRSLKANQTNKKKKPYYLADAMKFLIPYLYQPKPPSKRKTNVIAIGDNPPPTKMPTVATISLTKEPATTTNLGCTTKTAMGYVNVYIKEEPITDESPESSFARDDANVKQEHQNIENEFAGMKAVITGKTSNWTPNDKVSLFLSTIEPKLKSMTPEEFHQFTTRAIQLIDDITH